MAYAKSELARYLAEGEELYFSSHYGYDLDKNFKPNFDIKGGIDERANQVTANDLASGSLAYYLEEFVPAFKARGLSLTIGNEKIEWGEKFDQGYSQYIYHTIEINGKTREVVKGRVWSGDMPDMYKKWLLKTLNEELASQGSDEKVYELFQADISVTYFMILDEPLYNYFKSIQPLVKNAIY